jgi:hypothetical protein
VCEGYTSPPSVFTVGAVCNHISQADRGRRIK